MNNQWTILKRKGPLMMEERTTAGSTKAVQSSLSSNRAKTKETAADPRRMRTSWSLNCSRINSQRGVGGSSARARGMLVYHDETSR